ncbi:MAG: triose-phosphate isomerase [Syntrophomonadaceae bacterium]|nr:triose-phosphate isomerase [Syntrophomonadaceae bacterium]
MRKKVFAANWKMHKTRPEAVGFVDELMAAGPWSGEAELIICAPFTALAELAQRMHNTPVKVGAQNFYYEPQGAFTGEVSASMLKDVGCTHVIIGHSERRSLFAEDDGVLHLKLKTALEESLIPIFCVGESLEQRQAGEAEAVVRKQLTAALGELFPRPDQWMIAYEPVWAIGTGVTASPQDAQAMCKFIRSWLAERYGLANAAEIRILYGGSVKPANACELMILPDVDGALIGGASLEPLDFAEIVRRGSLD